MNALKKLRDLHAQVLEICGSNLSEETKYDLIFSPALAGQIRTLIDLDYCDPDTSYEEDIRAFVEALNEKMGFIERWANT
jgi:hypothetical protein